MTSSFDIEVADGSVEALTREVQEAPITRFNYVVSLPIANAKCWDFFSSGAV
ncbi:hypothetical protein RND71_002062 [Anisodus tanguticus]|uniref:Uncharacterized protein n=1 Tax=Anisodus tanguticus TaxID=243964 RepID=A0AAE1VYU5_9SOLA|nr:hypothetical protein RND71_002062 [Anisodus tanguticus]